MRKKKTQETLVDLAWTLKVASTRNCYSSPDWKTNTCTLNFKSKYFHRGWKHKNSCLTTLSTVSECYGDKMALENIYLVFLFLQYAEETITYLTSDSSNSIYFTYLLFHKLLPSLYFLCSLCKRHLENHSRTGFHYLKQNQRGCQPTKIINNKRLIKSYIHHTEN